METTTIEMMHPRKRKLRQRQETATNGHPHASAAVYEKPSNPYERFLHIRHQVCFIKTKILSNYYYYY